MPGLTPPVTRSENATSVRLHSAPGAAAVREGVLVEDTVAACEGVCEADFVPLWLRDGICVCDCVPVTELDTVCVAELVTEEVRVCEGVDCPLAV
jgi:hypothetical protein